MYGTHFEETTSMQSYLGVLMYVVHSFEGTFSGLQSDLDVLTCVVAGLKDQLLLCSLT